MSSFRVLISLKGIAMTAFAITAGVLVVLAASTWAAEQTKLPFDIYSGYFVSNKFEPDAAASFVVVETQKQFDQVFGVAFVMGDKSHRLPKDAFKSNMVLAAIKRGHSVWEYKVTGVTVEEGVVQLRYAVTSRATPNTTFACPLIMSMPRGEYKAAVFVEDGKQVKTVSLDRNRGQEIPPPKETPSRGLQVLDN